MTSLEKPAIPCHYNSSYLTTANFSFYFFLLFRKDCNRIAEKRNAYKMLLVSLDGSKF